MAEGGRWAERYSLPGAARLYRLLLRLEDVRLSWSQLARGGECNQDIRQRLVRHCPVAEAGLARAAAARGNRLSQLFRFERSQRLSASARGQRLGTTRRAKRLWGAL